MRLVLRVLLFEFTVSSALVLAGWIRVTAQVWPFAMDSLKAGFGGRAWARTWARTWRAALGLLVGVPVVAGWPVLLSPVLAKYTSGDWLTIASPGGCWRAQWALCCSARRPSSQGPAPTPGPGAGVACVANGVPAVERPAGPPAVRA